MFGITTDSYFGPLVFLFTFVALACPYLCRARTGMHMPEIRKVSGFEAVDGGRTVKMGRTLHHPPSWPETLGSGRSRTNTEDKYCVITRGLSFSIQR